MGTLWVLLRTKDQEASPEKSSLPISGVVENLGPKFLTVLLTDYGIQEKVYYDKHERDFQCKMVYDEDSECTHAQFSSNGSITRIYKQSILQVSMKAGDKA